MRNMLYVLIILAVLLVPTTALAEEPQNVEGYPMGGWLLGELFPINVAGAFPYERVDAYLYRPSTLDGWPTGWTQGPLVDPAVWPVAAWIVADESAQRRWSWAEAEGTLLETTNQFGAWSIVLMIPRDEVWYPCSFPLKWKCNFFDSATLSWEFHSPQIVDYLPGNIEGELWDFADEAKHWPWIDGLWGVEAFGPAADPQDIVGPLQIDVITESGLGLSYELVIQGYQWKVSDIPAIP